MTDSPGEAILRLELAESINYIDENVDVLYDKIRFWEPIWTATRARNEVNASLNKVMFSLAVELDARKFDVEVERVLRRTEYDYLEEGFRLPAVEPMDEFLKQVLI